MKNKAMSFYSSCSDQVLHNLHINTIAPGVLTMALALRSFAPVLLHLPLADHGNSLEERHTPDELGVSVLNLGMPPLDDRLINVTEQGEIAAATLEAKDRTINSTTITAVFSHYKQNFCEKKTAGEQR